MDMKNRIKTPAMSKPEHTKTLRVCTVIVPCTRPPEYKHPDPGMTAKRKSADTANIEGNESAKYERMEKKTLKGLKGGGSDKELRAGHNTRARKSKKTKGY